MLQTNAHDLSFEVQDFEADVLAASHSRPVLVDFWAPWCGPCRALGPVLEKLAQEPDTPWTLVKVNTDVHQHLAATYQIRGIPAVKLFSQGEAIDEFTGVLPEYAIRQWLEKALPSEEKKLLARAQLELEGGDEAAAEALLREVLATDPHNATARVLLARIVLFDDPAEAESLLADTGAFAGPGFVQIEQAVQTLAPLLQHPIALPEGAGRTAFAHALDALRRRDFDAALTHFIDVLRTDRYYHDDGARKACVALFNVLGPDHPATQRHRKTFDRSLY